MVNILGREEVDNRTAGKHYVEVFQAVILFGSDMWVAPPPSREGPHGLPPLVGLMDGGHEP